MKANQKDRRTLMQRVMDRFGEFPRISNNGNGKHRYAVTFPNNFEGESENGMGRPCYVRTGATPEAALRQALKDADKSER
jgi:hypothetical protein